VRKRSLVSSILAVVVLTVIACGYLPLARQAPPTPTPTKTPRANGTPDPTATSVTPTTSPPTATVAAPPTPTLPPPTDTPVLATPTATMSPVPTDTPVPPPPTDTPIPPSLPTDTPAPAPTLPPLEGGSWDMEEGFVPGRSPLGEDCGGWAVAAGWSAFVTPGNPASSCLNENKNPTNVHRGQRSQELTFDFTATTAGIYRTVSVTSGHRYAISAWGKHIKSASPIELALGIDLNGGQDHQAASVQWFPWDEAAEDAWVHTEETVTATGPSMTIFLKAHHPQPDQGGATLFDDVSLRDLGP
jgi:hypothetical protein